MPSKVPMTWQNQIPPYMFNFQNPGQLIPPYQAYPFSPYYPANMQWPQSVDESDHNRNRRSSSSRKKEKTLSTEEEELSESSYSDSGSDPEKTEQSHRKKHGKRSSKTVVIRNINYITSKKRNEERGSASYDSSSGDDVSVDEDSLHQKVKDVIGTLDRHELKSSSKKRGGDKNGSFVNGSNGGQEHENDSKSDFSKGMNGNEHWDAFQNLLLSGREPDTDTRSSVKGDIYGNGDPIQFESEDVKKRTVETDSFIVGEKAEVNEGRVDMKDFEIGEVSRSNMKRRDSVEDALFFPERPEEPKGVLTDIGSESSGMKHGSGEDWFVVNHSGKLENRVSIIEQTMVDSYALSSEGDRSHMESKKIVPIDDSFMVQAHTSSDEQYHSHWKTDISMVSDVIATDQSGNDTRKESQNKVDVSNPCEPDDLFVVLARDSEFGSVGKSWSSEVDYGVEASIMEAENKPVSVKMNEKAEEKKPVNGKIPTNGVVKQMRPKGLQGSVAKSRIDALAKSRKPAPLSRSVSQKSKLEKEEEARRRAEELVIERQKRIAERSSASGVAPAAAKRVPLGSKVASPKTNSPKPGITNSTKNHFANGQVKRRTSA